MGPFGVGGDLDLAAAAVDGVELHGELDAGGGGGALGGGLGDVALAVNVEERLELGVTAAAPRRVRVPMSGSDFISPPVPAAGRAALLGDTPERRWRSRDCALSCGVQKAGQRLDELNVPASVLLALRDRFSISTAEELVSACAFGEERFREALSVDEHTWRSLLKNVRDSLPADLREQLEKPVRARFGKGAVLDRKAPADLERFLDRG